MNYSIFRFTLNMHSHRSQASIPAFYGDTAIRLAITLTDGGNPYFINDGCIATLSGTKADGTILNNHCSIQNNIIVYDFTEQTTSCAGVINCEITLIGPDGAVITAPKFIIVVDEKEVVGEYYIESEDEENVYNHIMAAASNEQARINAETARKNAETLRAEAETLRVEAEKARDDAEKQRQEDHANRSAEIASKVASKASSSNKNRAYVVDGNGNDTTLAYSANINPYEIVQRTSSGNIPVPTPISDNHATSKQFVKQYVEEDSELANRVTTLEGVLIEFKETENEAHKVRVPEKSSGLAFVQSFANRVSRNRITNTSASGANATITKIDEGVFKIKGTGTLPTINFSTPFQDINDGQQYYFGYHIEGTLTPTDEEAPSEHYTLVGPDGPEYGETIGSGYQAEYHLEPTMQFECNMDFTITMWLSVDPMTYEEYESPKNVIVTAIESQSANVLDMSVVGSRTHSQSGLTLAYDETENCLVLNGTNPNATAYDAFSVPYNLVLDASKKYSIAIEVLSGTVSGAFSAKLRFTGSDTVESIVLSSTTSPTLMTNTPGLTSFTRIDIYIPANGSADNFKFRLAFNEQEADATVPMPYNDLFKHTYTIPQGIQEMSEYKYFLATPYEVESILSFVDKTITYWTDPFGSTETKDVSAYLTNGISGLPVPVEAGGILRFVNSDNAPVTSGITFLMSKV